MARKNRFALSITKVAGPRTGGIISSQHSNLPTNKEGTTNTLPFFVNSFEELSRQIKFDSPTIHLLKEVARLHRVKIPSHYLGLMDETNPSCPIRQQAV